MHACMVWWSGGRRGRSPVSLVHGPLLPSAQGGRREGCGVGSGGGGGGGGGVRPEATRCDPLVACGQLRRHQDGPFGAHLTCGLTRGRTGASARRGGRRVDPRRSRSRRWARWRRCSRADVRRVSSGSGRFGGDPQEGPWPLLRVQVRPNLGTICKPTARAPKGGGVRVVVEEAAAEGDVLLPARAALRYTWARHGTARHVGRRVSSGTPVPAWE